MRSGIIGSMRIRKRDWYQNGGFSEPKSWWQACGITISGYGKNGRLSLYQ